jgi:poly-gamma-glutamate synthesis protein (capsule biosynthesis protein)
VISAGGVRIGVVGLADHPADCSTPARPGIAWVSSHDPAQHGSPAWLLSEVAQMAGSCGVVAVGLHWGPNMELRPQPHHVAVASSLAAAGASVVAGHSAHVVRSIQLLDGTPVCYDLGDLLDDYAVDPELRNDLGVLAYSLPGSGSSLCRCASNMRTRDRPRVTTMPGSCSDSFQPPAPPAWAFSSSATGTC